MKDIFLNHRSDSLQRYEYILTHGDTWLIFIPPSLTISKGNPMGYVQKRPLLSSEMMSKRLYMSKLINKILNVKTIFGPECSSLKTNCHGIHK